MQKLLLSLEHLSISIDDKPLIQDISFSIEPGKIYTLMGPNGSGKSTLAAAIAGHPNYHVTGTMLFNGEDIRKLSPDLRAKNGIFLSFQYPKSIPGVSISNFLRTAYKAVHQKEMRVFEFQKKLKSTMEFLDIPISFMERSINEGFSGGEKKKTEILQAMILEPKLIILDETDSGLDIDALRVVADGVKKLMTPSSSILLITHYERILKYLTPDHVLVMKHGRIIAQGGKDLAAEIEEKGFEHFKEKAPSKKASLTIID